ncbi:IclR family transcriptional regulator [Sneathiella chinensis]|nr:IclR family transcriptional regulator [Sneathiella chinensis]
MRSDKETDKGQTARSGPQSVGRIFSILEVLSSSRAGATLSELASTTGAPKTSLVGLLAGLVAERCLIRNEAGRYFVGPRFIALAMKTVSGRELVTLLKPVMEELVEQTGETAVFAVLDQEGDLVNYVAKVESSNPIRYAVTVGERRELYCTALGKVLLAHFPADQRQAYLEKTLLRQHTDNTLTDRAALEQELKRIRDEGIAHTQDELFIGASGIAAPILSSDGTVIGALAVAGPTERFIANVKIHEKYLVKAATECTLLAGGLPAPQKPGNRP